MSRDKKILLAEHFYSEKRSSLLGTFVIRCQRGTPLFGWSRYNFLREREDNVPFGKNIGIETAVESTYDQIVVDTRGFLHKGNTVIQDKEMCHAAIKFLVKYKIRFKRLPKNVRIVFNFEYLENIIEIVRKSVLRLSLLPLNLFG